MSVSLYNIYIAGLSLAVPALSSAAPYTGVVAYHAPHAMVSMAASSSSRLSVPKRSKTKSRASSYKSKGKKNVKTKTGKSGSTKTGKSGSAKTGKKRISQRWANPPQPAVETPSNDSLTLTVNTRLLEVIPSDQNPGGLRVNKVTPDHNSRLAKISLNENFTYLPVTAQLIESLTKEVRSVLPDSIKDYRVALNVGPHSLSYYITNVQKLPEKYRKNPNFVVAADPWVHPSRGMENDIIALWPSHGKYYKTGAGAWMWQRPFLFQSVEDTYTMGYVLPYLVPMLENAGAYVMLPRERDTNSYEVIVDNDTNPDGQIFSQPYYKEKNGIHKWTQGEEEGFIYDLPDFRDTENPFENGTYRQIQTQKSGAPGIAAWYADIPQDGEYAVYVSYKTLANSTPDAHYTVNYSGGSREFRVNQTMGGNTWVYLGTFPLEQGYSDTEPIVTLSNLSGHDGMTVTADAVKIGGGMGNIARSPQRRDVAYDPSTPFEETEEDDDDKESEDAEEEPAASPEPSASSTSGSKQSSDKAPTFKTSGVPRYLEGARYWLHWAGFPEEVYSPHHGADDYKDDYTSRGLWVNYLAGGSRVLPDDEGLGIPVDLVFALHSDAGKRSDDSYVGTLGIYYTQGGASYTDGTARINSRMLTDMVMRQIVSDVRREWEPRWTRRSMWDKSYVEARVPEVPTALIELLSHQNFADMRYGLDPRFKFTVSRAIYKALGRFMAERKGREFTVQPLPVKDFSIRRTRPAHYKLEWEPTSDPAEPTAKPSKYIILERSGDELGFHKIGETHSTHFDIRTGDNEIHSFKVIAANEGGLSFPSETLALRDVREDQNPVLIVNGFTRISGPESFAEENTAGFDAAHDFGVPYIKEISYTGRQTEFKRSAGESFGKSSSNEVARIIAGNTFDYPAIHGRAIASAGRGFVSSSLGAVEKGTVDLNDYKTVDLILGRQQATVTGEGHGGAEFMAFDEKIRNKISQYLGKGGRLLVTGEKVASDAAGNFSDDSARKWLRQTLGVLPDTLAASSSSRIETLPSGVKAGFANRIYPYSSTLNEAQYQVQSPDALVAAEGFESIPLMTYTDNDGVATLLLRKGRQKQIVSSIPLESLTDANQRNLLMQEYLNWLDR